MIEKTFAMVKPDGVRRGLVGKIIARFEDHEFQISELKKILIDTDLADRHYGEHKGKPFYNDLMAFITSGPVVAMVIEGESAISIVRKLCGETDSVKAAPGTIRGDFATKMNRNIIHSSDSPESAKREISIFFEV
jgi:nucleoside-diphosphate kinase